MWRRSGPDFGRENGTNWLRQTLLGLGSLTGLDAFPLSKYSNMCEAGYTSPAVQAVYLPVVALALPSGKAVAIRPMQDGVPMRDLVADWKRWSRAERVLAVTGTLLMVALPLGLLMTG